MFHRVSTTCLFWCCLQSFLAARSALADLRHHWRLDETQGLVAAETAGGADGFLGNFENDDDTQWVPGQFAGGLNLGADPTYNNYVQANIPEMSAAATGGFTILLWINPGDVIFGSGEYQLLSTPGDAVGFTIMNNVSEGVLHDRVLLFWDSNYPAIYVGTTSLEPGTWYHVAVTSTGAGGVREYYVDGVREVKAPWVPSQGAADVGTADGWAAGPIQIGGFGGGRTHNSMIDDVRIYDEVLDEAGILEAMNTPPPRLPNITNFIPAQGEAFHDPAQGLRFDVEVSGDGITLPDGSIHVVLNGADVTGDLAITGSPTSRQATYSGLLADTSYDALITATDSAGATARHRHLFATLKDDPGQDPALSHHFKLDERAGLAAVDSVTGRLGLLGNFEAADDTQWVAGRVDGGLNLGADATFNNYVQFAIDRVSALESGGFTIAMWLNPGLAIVNPGEYQLLSTPGDAVGFTIMNLTSEGVLHERVLLFWDSSTPNLFVGTTPLEPGTWYHVAITSTGAGGERQFYLNGLLEEKAPWVPSQGGLDIGTADGWQAGTAQIGGIGGGRTHDSIVDDVRIYNRVLAPEEIEELVPGPSAPVFHRGDTDDNRRLELTDAVRTLNFLFTGGPPPVCLDAGDADDNGRLELTDAVRVLNFLFAGGPPPAAPGPPTSPCGPDAGGELGCVTYTSC